MAGYIGSRLSNSVVNLDGVTIGSATKFQPFIGSIAAFAMSSAPSGWLVCNGAEYAIADYGDLYGVISTTWGALTDGAGNSGTTHFVVPDLRGEFLRGFDNGQGNDPDAASRTGGDAVGSSQRGGAANIYKMGAFYGGGPGETDNYTLPEGEWSAKIRTGNSTGTVFWYRLAKYAEKDDTNSATYRKETRPKNKYVQYCIKY